MSPNKLNTTQSRCFAAAAATLLSLASPARSQNDNSEVDVYDLNELVIVANRSEVPLSQIGSSIEILDNYDLTKSEQSFLLDSLRYVPRVLLTK